MILLDSSAVVSFEPEDRLLIFFTYHWIDLSLKDICFPNFLFIIYLPKVQLNNLTLILRMRIFISLNLLPRPPGDDAYVVGFVALGQVDFPVGRVVAFDVEAAHEVGLQAFDQ